MSNLALSRVEEQAKHRQDDGGQIEDISLKPTHTAEKLMQDAIKLGIIKSQENPTKDRFD